MKKYWVYFKAQWQDTLEYRGNIVIYAIANSVMPFLGLFLWLSASSGVSNLVFSRPELVAYFLLIALVNLLTTTWGNWFTFESINSGDFAKYLIKPFSLVEDFLINSITQKVFQLVIFSGVLVVLGYLLLGKSITEVGFTSLSVLLFFPSLLLAMLISILFSIIIGLTTFWFYDIDFLTSSTTLANTFFSGKIIPLVFLPGFLSGIAFYSPFRYMLSFPVEVMMGKVVGLSLVQGFAMQLFWLGIMVISYKVIYARGAKKYEGYGQ